jgi:hypothetical protein
MISGGYGISMEFAPILEIRVILLRDLNRLLSMG